MKVNRMRITTVNLPFLNTAHRRITDHHQPERTCSTRQSRYLLFLPKKRKENLSIFPSSRQKKKKKKNVGVKISKRQKLKDRAPNKTERRGRRVGWGEGLHEREIVCVRESSVAFCRLVCLRFGWTLILRFI